MSKNNDHAEATDAIFKALEEQGGHYDEAIDAERSTVTATMKNVTVSTNQMNADTHKPDADEATHTAEFAKVNAAIEMAETAGIIKRRIINPSGEPHCVIMGTIHRLITEESPDECFASETQMFQLLYCFQHNNADNNPLYCEGVKRGSERLRIELETDFMSSGLYSLEGQQYLYQHPDDMKEILRIVATQHPDISFDGFSAYRNLQGIHDPKLHTKMERILEQEVAGKMDVFHKKYPIFGKNIQIESVIHRESGRAGVTFDGKGYFASEVVEDCNNYLAAIQALDANSLEREQELVSILSQDHGEKVPMAWVGLAHLKRLANACVAKNMCVHAVNPTVAERLACDERTYVLFGDRSNTIAGVPQVIQIRDYAAQLCQK